MIYVQIPNGIGALELAAGPYHIDFMWKNKKHLRHVCRNVLEGSVYYSLTGSAFGPMFYT